MAAVTSHPNDLARLLATAVTTSYPGSWGSEEERTWVLADIVLYTRKNAKIVCPTNVTTNMKRKVNIFVD